jgi:hypothetical protein
MSSSMKTKTTLYILLLNAIWIVRTLYDRCRCVCVASLNPYTVGRTPWMGDQPIARPLRTHRTTQAQNKRTQTSMPWVGFEPTIPAFERAKTVHALDRERTLLGTKIMSHDKWKSVRDPNQVSPDYKTLRCTAMPVCSARGSRVWTWECTEQLCPYDVAIGPRGNFTFYLWCKQPSIYENHTNKAPVLVTMSQVNAGLLLHVSSLRTRFHHEYAD